MIVSEDNASGRESDFPVVRSVAFIQFIFSPPEKIHAVKI